MVTAAAATIPRAAPASAGLDFAALKAEAIAAIERFAGSRWTDFNAHDPGVTILEQLCYALTDLAYRTDFPIADLLADAAGTLPASRFALHPSWRLLPTPPVTIADFRRLLLDRVPGLGNVWLTANAAGRYDIVVQPMAVLPGIDPTTHPRRVAARVRRTFHRHRPLGEDLGEVRVLLPVPVRVAATLHLDHAAIPAAVMADALFALGLALAPEPRRIGLADLPVGTTPLDLFEGPLLIHGLLPADQLADRPATIAVGAVADLLGTVAGVTGVHDLLVSVDDVEVADCRTIAADRRCILDAGFDLAEPPLRLMVAGRACPIDRAEVRRRLAELWRRQRRTFPLKAAYRAAFPTPHGRARDLTSFTPLADQFPAVYAIGRGTPISPVTDGLRGFLAIFEMLMVDYLDRLGDLGDLLDGVAPAATPLGGESLRARIPTHLAMPVIAHEDDVLARLRIPPDQQEQLLDFLLVLHGETAGDVPVPPRLRMRAGAAVRHRIEVKHALLGRIVALGRRHGRGFDQGGGAAARRAAWIELRTRIMLGDHDVADVRQRRRVAFVEHLLLRPRPDGPDRPDDAAVISAVIQLPRDCRADGAYRRQLADAVRTATPAHLVLRLYLVDRPHWRSFARLHSFWRRALRAGDAPATSVLAAELRALLAGWPDPIA